MNGIKLTRNFNEEAFHAYHNGDFNDQDEYYDYMMSCIDNEVIYTHRAKQIIDALDYDVFEDHDTFGRAENWSQAAYAALYDHLMETAVTFDDIELEITENER